MKKNIAVWFPCVKAGTGSDVFTIRLVDALIKRGVKAEITWLPPHAEYLPWLVKVPETPIWATHVHVNSWLHKRFIPKGLSVIVTSHLCVHDKVLTQYKSMLQRLYHHFWVKNCERNSFRLANKITAVSMFTAEKNKEVFGLEHITPIHNWVDHKLFIPSDKKVNNKKFKLLYVGNLSLRKGSDLLPQIMKKLGGDFELYFTGNQKNFYRGKVLPNNMFSLGCIKNTKELIGQYQQSDALLFPTRSEGLSLAAIEAASCGLVIITNDISSMPEVIEDSVTGFLCAADNVEEFSKKIKQLANNPIMLKELSVNGRIKVKRDFSENILVEKYLSLYKSSIK